MIKLTRKVHFTRRPNRSRAMIVEIVPPSAPIAPGRLPRVSRLMALAIHFDRMIREAKVTDLSELARLAHVTQPRMTQIMNLNHLAPDIQEEILLMPKTLNGRDPIHEKLLRPICAGPDWHQQRIKWQLLQSSVKVSRINPAVPGTSGTVSPVVRAAESRACNSNS